MTVITINNRDDGCRYGNNIRENSYNFCDDTNDRGDYCDNGDNIYLVITTRTILVEIVIMVINGNNVGRIQ